MKKARGIFLKNENEIGLMREAGRIVSLILDEIGQAVKPGVSTMLFEDIARRMCDQFKVRPAFLGYLGFPFAICCSVNEVIVHGFPSTEHFLKEGDIVLVKGSQSMRMERTVKEFMAEPDRAAELLVRQDAEWHNR